MPSEISRDDHWLWLEEYEKCMCTNVTETRGEALGYCPIHGNDRRRLDDGEMELGLA